MLSSTNTEDDALGLATPALDQGTAEFTFGDDFLDTNNSLDAFLTSPIFGDSPIEETPLFTPALGLSSARGDVNASPIIPGSVDDNFDFSLFGGPIPSVTESTHVLGLLMTPDSPAKNSFQNEQLFPDSPTTLYTMQTPALPHANLYPSPRLPSVPLPTPDLSASASAACTKTRGSRSTAKAVHTGHRKNLAISSLVPIDAPTQPRNYLTPSLTSRQAMPPSLMPKRASTSRKRSRAQADLDDEDEDEDDDVDVSMLTEVELKRRQNTIAARKSRMRKKEHVFALQAEIAQLTAERDELAERNEVLVERLRLAGLPTD